MKIKKSRSHKTADRYVYGKGRFYYVDFSGFLEVSRQGNVYMVLIVDRYTRLIVGFFVKKMDKNTAIELIRQYIKENPYIKFIKTSIYRSQDFVFLQS